MRSRGLVVVLALILATLATVGVFLYSRGVKEDAKEGGDLVTVVVSKVDIAANTDLNQLISDGEFTTREIPSGAVIENSITEISQLQDRRTSVFIFAGEQIPLERVQGGTVPGGVLSIPEGHQALTVALDAPRAISATLVGGDHVTIYATFRGVEVVKLNKRFQVRTNEEGATPARFDTTVILVPDVEVLRVIRPTTTQAGSFGDQTEEPSVTGNVQVILAFLPEEAQKFVFALEQGSLYLSLLPPGQAGVELDPLTIAQIIVPERASSATGGATGATGGATGATGG